MVAWESVALTLLGLLAVSGAALIALRGVRNASTWFIVGTMGGLGTLQLLVAAGSVGYDAVGTPFFHGLRALTLASVTAFAIVYPGWATTPLQRWAAAWCFLPAAAYVVALVVDPPLLLRPGSLPLASYTLFHLVTASVAAIVLAVRWVRSAPGPYRTQFLWVLLPFLFGAVHDSVPFLAPPSSTPRRALAAVTLVAVAAFAAFAWWRARGRPQDAAREDRTFSIAIVAFFAVSMVQVAVPTVQVHFVFDGVATLLLLYGVARYRVVDIDLRLRRGIRRGTLGAVGFAILVAVEQGAAEYVGSAYGYALGALLAGVAVLLFRPLHRLAESVSEKATVDAASTANYLSYRKMEIYRVALEGMLRDGALEPRETRTLAGLRAELGVSEAEHDLLERDLRGRLAPSAMIV